MTYYAEKHRFTPPVAGFQRLRIFYANAASFGTNRIYGGGGDYRRGEGHIKRHSHCPEKCRCLLRVRQLRIIRGEAIGTIRLDAVTGAATKAIDDLFAAVTGDTLDVFETSLGTS